MTVSGSNRPSRSSSSSISVAVGSDSPTTETSVDGRCCGVAVVLAAVEERCDAVTLAEAFGSSVDLSACSGAATGGACCIAANTRKSCSAGFGHSGCVNAGNIGAGGTGSGGGRSTRAGSFTMRAATSISSALVKGLGRAPPANAG